MSAGEVMVMDDALESAPDALIGRGVRLSDSYAVGREKVREYARAVQDYHPVHWDAAAATGAGYRDVVAPLTFLSLVGIKVFEKMLGEVLVAYDPSGIIQTDQTMTFHRPVTVGDLVTSTSVVSDLRRAGGGDLITTKNVVMDLRGTPLVTGYTGLMARPPGEPGHPIGADFAAALKSVLRHDIRHAITPPFGPPPGEPEGAQPVEPPKRAGRPLLSADVGAELPPRTLELTLGDLVNYAGVSGDSNPIHWSAETARLAGLERGVVAHGMLLMGLGAAYLTSWLGDPGAVRDYSVRMTSPVYVTHDRPGVVELSGRVKSVDQDSRTAVVALTALHSGKKVFGRATATVQLS
ncbi:(R)-hydratase [Nocardia panacis]|uniref:(R)-hydratase n=1 Tax=Nocardia panacis TaxID=2340916 RepID=A0A3A4KYV6_9NOCA|nr:fused (3R)-hydroxyacyl-ACP dehydratase subunits HadA/HadB [Nocardia panacis]RJO74707.1 (R)-hydratase [Nocardia panacis]